MAAQPARELLHARVVGVAQQFAQAPLAVGRGLALADAELPHLAEDAGQVLAQLQRAEEVPLAGIQPELAAVAAQVEPVVDAGIDPELAHEMAALGAGQRRAAVADLDRFDVSGPGGLTAGLGPLARDRYGEQHAAAA